MSSALDVTMTERHGTIAVLTVVGELDLNNGPLLADAALEAAGQGRPHVILEMSRVPFCDSSGLNALIRLYRRLRAEEGSLTLAAVPARLTRLLSMTGIDRLIPAHAEVPEALEAVRDATRRESDAGAR
ncbi:STAS domain-containing protein [Actinomadura algeriensis]|uniref:Anti-sigma factor antagonist n=1 Tax=Actinomadura algeriensis TaxID=1679523 RepID=A0ABR9JXW3_9ACTN|nr:STAS domain-containing protein [Actinomadura algeriensis]MBE1535229.1 anti-sigma B factor antagonist [Actinomadura algeriensis]